MTAPIAFDTGVFLPAKELSIPVYDTGFILGVTISEQLRTFGGKLFALDRHLQRLARSLEILGLNPGLTLEQIGQAAEEVASHNHPLLAPGDDIGCTILVSPGGSSALAPPGEERPRVRIHTQPLPFAQWRNVYDEGVALAVPTVRQTPATCWPPELKCRSRMHYYLADRQAHAIDPAARAIILDQQDRVLEATTANLLIFNKDTGVASPPLDQILPGVSLQTVEMLAQRCSIPFHYRPLTLHDLETADEVWLCSTSPCIWSVVRLNGKPVGRVGKETIASRMLEEWSKMVGVDIAKQASRFADRSSAIY